MYFFVRGRSFSIALFLGVGFGLTLILGNRSPLATAGPAAAAQAVRYDWLQMNGDAQHSGNNTKETILGQSNVASLQFLFQVTLPTSLGEFYPGADGAPVALTSVETPSGTRDLLFSTMKSGTLIASDAATGAQVWLQPHPYSGAGGQYTNSSPAIDPNRLYVYSYGLDGYAHKHQVGDGAEIIDGIWPQLTSLKPQWDKATGALTIARAASGATYLYVAHGGYRDDQGDYQGHVTAINLADGTQNVFNALCSDQPVHFVLHPGLPNCVDQSSLPINRAAIWAKDGVIYDNVTDRIYMATGNGPYDANSGGHNWGDSVLALNPDGTGSGGNPLDSYTPAEYDLLETQDRDLGCTGPAILPSSPLAPPGYAGRLAVQGGKDKKLKLIDLTNMSGQGGPGHVGGETVFETQSNGLFSVPAVWTNPDDGTTWVFVMNNGTASAYRLGFPGGVPSLVKQWQQPLPGKSPLVANNVIYYANGDVIRAVSPLTGNVLWSDTAHSGSLHWQSPIVFNGRVYLTDDAGHLTAWALPPAATPTETPTITPTAGTPTETPAITPTAATPTETPTTTPTAGTPTETPAITPTAGTPTETPAITPTAGTPTETPTITPTAETPTQSPTNAATNTPADTRTGTATITPTSTRTGTATRTATRTPTRTPTKTNTPTTTPTRTATSIPPTKTLTRTPTSIPPTKTPTNAPTGTAAPTPTPTPGNVVLPPFADFRDVRRAADINAGPDLGGTGHAAINFTGTTGGAGDAWITVYDAVPATTDEDSVYGSVSLSADVLIQAYNNKKGAGLLALFNEGAGKQGLSLLIIDSGNTDSLVLGAVNPATGLFTTLATVSLAGNILENAWYRLTMDVAVSGANVTVTAKVFRHSIATDPNSLTGAQVNGTLTFSGARPPGVDATGEVGIVAYAQGVVNSSVTNFTIYP